MAPQSSTLLSPSELSYLHTSLSLTPPIRPDSRTPTSFRPLIAETDFLPSTNGSARLCFADGTEAIVGVKSEVEKSPDHTKANSAQNEEMQDPSIGKDDEGKESRGGDKWIEVTVDMPGFQRDDDAMVVFLAAMLHEALVADGGLRDRLFINARWHWRIFVDVLLLSPPRSYPLPLLSLTTHLALLSTRLPAPISGNDEDPLFNDDWEASLPLYPSSTKPPITLLVISVGSNIFFDPSREELAVADAVLAVSLGFASTNLVGHGKGSRGVKILAIRTIDPPARLSAPGVGEEGEEGVWRAKRGGMSRGSVAEIMKMVVERGGVGEEVMSGLEGWKGN